MRRFWAPEIHFNQGAWYVYFAAAPSRAIKDDLFQHRVYAISTTAANPLDGPFLNEQSQSRRHSRWSAHDRQAIASSSPSCCRSKYPRSGSTWWVGIRPEDAMNHKTSNPSYMDSPTRARN